MSVLPHPCKIQHLSEAQFYNKYAWCLNPLLTLQENLDRLREELIRYEHLNMDWQRHECIVNLHLFACSIMFGIEDYFAWQPWTFSAFDNAFPRLSMAVQPGISLINFSRLLQSQLGDRAVAAWTYDHWRHCVDRICEALIGESEPTAEQWTQLRETLLQAMDSAKLPKRISQRVLRIPEGYRDQDMAHQDAQSLIKKFLQAHPDFEQEGEICVIGVRTAGAFFAPVVKAYLVARGFSCVNWMSLRPKETLSPRETERLQGLANRMARVFVIDDHPNTGATFFRLCEHLQQAGVSHDRINILAPGHPVRPQWTLPELSAKGVTIIRLEPEEFHKAKLLQPSEMEPLLRAYFLENEGDTLRIRENPQIDSINERLEEARRSSFQVHIKRVFEIELHRADHQPAVVKRILGKSVGWGWLGYHGYIAGVHLEGFVPQVIGLRNGLLFTQWLDGSALAETAQQTVTSGKWSIPRPDMPDCVPGYVAKRVEQLRLAHDPCFTGNANKSTFPNRTIVDELTDFLGSVYDSRVLARLKMRALRSQVQRYASPFPTLVDGQMGLDEWIQTPTGIMKVDFEHYNFIRAALKTADSAYDLAAASFEFQLSETAEKQLLDEYIDNSGDVTIGQRVLIYKLIYVTKVMQLASNRVNNPVWQKREMQNQRYIAGRNFLIRQMHRFCANNGSLNQTAEFNDVTANQIVWSKRLFLLDLDGVFDRPLLGAGHFPHTTASGPIALSLLKAGGFSVVPTTGRSLELVKHFCQTFGLPGAIAEHGSVLFDATTGREQVLIDDEAIMQLVRFKEAIQELPGVFLDPSYRYTLRIYRYSNHRTIPPHAEEIRNLLVRTGCDRLIPIIGHEETYIVHKGVDKATGLAAFKQHLGGFDGLVAAIGDSTPDLPMLKAAQFSYAPANCSSKIREAAASLTHLHVMDQPYQQGLLAAAHDAIKRAGGDMDSTIRIEAILKQATNQADDGFDREVIGNLLRVAERSRLQQILALFNWRAP